MAPFLLHDLDAKIPTKVRPLIDLSSRPTTAGVAVANKYSSTYHHYLSAVYHQHPHRSKLADLVDHGMKRRWNGKSSRWMSWTYRWSVGRKYTGMSFLSRSVLLVPFPLTSSSTSNSTISLPALLRAHNHLYLDQSALLNAVATSTTGDQDAIWLNPYGRWRLHKDGMRPNQVERCRNDEE